MTLRLDVVDVGNVIVMMCDVYVHGGCSDHVGYPWWGEIKWLKSFKHLWREMT